MPDIKITINTKNLTSSELQRLLRDVETLRQRYNEAGNASKDFGDHVKTASKQVELVSDVVSTVFQELKQLTTEEQQIIGKTTSFIETQNTALQEQVLILEARVVALETQLTALQKQKTIVEEQTTAGHARKTIAAAQTTKVYELEKVVVTSKRINRELLERVDLEKLINVEIERRKIGESVRFPAYFREPVEGVGYPPNPPQAEGIRHHPLTQLGADHPDNQLPSQPTAPRSTKTAFDRGPSATVQDVPGLDFIAAVPDPTARHAPIQVPDIGLAQQTIIDTVSSVPVDLLGATYESLITVPQQMQQALSELREDTKMRIQEVKNSEVMSAQEKAKRIEEIERNAAQRRKEIEAEASQAKIAAFNKVVMNFIGGIGRMIAEQVKLKAASAATNHLFGASGQAGSSGLLGAAVPFLAANPALAIGGGLALGAAALFSESFDDPVNDAMARQAGMRQANTRTKNFARSLGINSAQDLTREFESGFEDGTAQVENESGTTQQVAGGAMPPIQNHITLRIGEQEMKVLHEETQRNIKRGIISSPS